MNFSRSFVSKISAPRYRKITFLSKIFPRSSVRKISKTWRRNRFRTTAFFETFFPTTTANFAAPRLGEIKKIKPSTTIFFEREKHRSNSREEKRNFFEIMRKKLRPRCFFWQHRKKFSSFESSSCDHAASAYSAHSRAESVCSESFTPAGFSKHFQI